MELYRGYTALTDEQMAHFYSDDELFDKSDLFENQYIICKDQLYRYNAGFIKRVDYSFIENS